MVLMRSFRVQPNQVSCAHTSRGATKDQNYAPVCPNKQVIIESVSCERKSLIKPKTIRTHKHTRIIHVCLIFDVFSRICDKIEAVELI